MTTWQDSCQTWQNIGENAKKLDNLTTWQNKGKIARKVDNLTKLTQLDNTLEKRLGKLTTWQDGCQTGQNKGKKLTTWQSWQLDNT